MTSCDTNVRLTEVLELFLLPNYTIVSTTYFDLLLSHISEQFKDETADNQNHCELLQKWVLKAIDQWKTGQKPIQSVAIFTVKLIGVIARSELKFHYWYWQNVYKNLRDILEIEKDTIPVSIKMAYTTMLTDFIVHRSGRRWIIESGAWKDVVQFAHKNHTLYVTRASQKFLWTFLTYEYQDVDTCKEIILTLSAPFITSTIDAPLHKNLEETYLDQNKSLCSTLDLITSILENTVFLNMDNTIPELFEELVNLEVRVKALFEACISTRLLRHVHKLLLLTLFLKLKQSIKGHNEVIDTEGYSKFRYGLRYITMLLLSKKYIIELLETDKYAMIYWKKLRSLREFALPEQHKFEHQIIALMVIPLCLCIKKGYMCHDLFDMFLNKIFDVTSTTIQRLAYNIRDTIWKEDLPLEQICKVSIDKLLELLDIMDRDVAVITFQTLCHVLKNYMTEGKDSGKSPSTADASPKPAYPDYQRKPPYRSILEGDPIVDAHTLLASLLNGLAVMMEKFNLKWQECVETICVLSLAQGILNHPGALPMICVKALKVCKLAIQYFMPPNLALLVDSDSHMNDIGPTLFKRLHDQNWEVRDSVLEVLNTIAIISEDKYPAFQEFLLTHKFLPVAIDIAVSDGESYVRASALMFISSTVRINNLWNKQLCHLNLPDTAIKLHNNENEAIVRREAVVLIKELYVHRNWPKSVIESMSRAMSAAAVFDLHWEVKINALEYWRHFIKSHFSDQGMLDGAFPNVTFSKEHRKIVALNEMEIKRRLNKALDELAKQSCLGVLLVTLEDDSDLEVCKTSAVIINRLKGFLLKYKLDEPFPEQPLPKDSATMDTQYVKQPETVTSSCSTTTNANLSNVIEEIVDANDANLLASMYQSSMKMDEEAEKSEEKTMRYISCVTREDFLRVIFHSDIDARIEEKSRWLNTYTSSFESVLEDLINAHRQGNQNTMDCY